ncbi:hypothetical protein EAO77_34015 [Streptomyces sp. t39]|nr:hypothetical protein EAO77_34015 [Streptomyces sp. t39]
MYDLRYSSRVLADAAREGRRPLPRRVRRAVVVYTFLRSRDDRLIGAAATIAERRARALLRSGVVSLLRAARTPPGSAAADAVGAADVPPVRHRHGALW